MQKYKKNRWGIPMEFYSALIFKSLAMKLSIALPLLFITTLQVSAYTFGQNINIQKKNIKLEAVLKELQKQSGYNILYKESLLSNTKRVDVDYKNVKLENVLSEILSSYAITYKVVDKNIILSSNAAVDASLFAAPNSQPITIQQRLIRGRVTDLDGLALVGATISEKGTSNNASTDDNGSFELNLKNEDGRIHITMLGFGPQEISTVGKIDFLIRMTPLVTDVDEVVVVGYGTQKKVNLTGAVDVVSGKSLQNRPTNNVAQAMAGTVPGLRISYGSAGFEPGAAPGVQIRGQGAPYVLIDGVVGDLSLIDPNSIESISVLKDAAASAIYGARAPYGVLLVTTKAGQNNQKPQLDFSINAGPTSIINKPKMIDSYTFVRAMNEMHDNQGVSRLFTEETIDRIIARITDPSLPETVPDALNPTKWSTYTNSNGNNDWIDFHYGNGFRSQENVSLRGGGEDVSYYLSFGHAYEKGVLKMVSDTYNRYNINAKVNVKLTDWWTLSSNTRMINAKRDKPIYNGEGGYGMLIHQILRTHPEVYLKSPNGHYSQLSRVPQMQAGYQMDIGNNLIQRVATKLKLTNNWTIDADYAFDYKLNSCEGLNTVAYEDEVDGNLVPISLTVPSYITKNKDNNSYKSLNLFTNYSLSLEEKSQFDFMVGYQQESSDYDWLSGVKRELITAEVPSITTATGEMLVYDDLSHWSTQGFFGRLNYNYDNKYLFESNIRYDGTSKFAEEKRWGFFPSFSAGWNVSHEAFFESIRPTVNSLKVRASWGKLGNQNVTAYQDLALLSIKNNLNWMLNGKRPPYTTSPNLVNKALTWESSQTTNFGLDVGVLGNRMQFSFDYYQRLTFDRLGPAKALPAVIGTAIPQENNSELKTKGWDFSWSWSDVTENGLSYSIGANISDYKNIITKYNNPTGTLTTDYVGKTVNEIWGYESVGLINNQQRADEINNSGYQKFINGQPWNTGDVEYRDLNGDGVINNGKNTIHDHGDLKVIGNSTPRYIFGLNLSAQYKGFDAAVFIQGTAKRDLWLTGNVFWGFNQWNQTSLFPHHMDYYRDTEDGRYSGLGVNTEAYFPRPYSNSAQDNKNKQVQTRYLQNGAYARLQNLQIGYTFTPQVLTKVKLKSARIYFSGENIYTLSSLKPGFDPETANLGEYGNGKGMFSQAIWAVGLNVSY